MGVAQTLLAISLDELRRGYLLGWFPMAEDDSEEISWYAPRHRAVFWPDQFHASTSLKKRIKRGDYEVRYDFDFETCMRACRRPSENWITEPLIAIYAAAHRAGWAHSCEIWRDGALIGGTYGVSIGSVFCAESMFHRETDASKLALYHLFERARDRGYTLIDAQMMSPHLQTLGAVEMGQREYVGFLSERQKDDVRFN